MLRAEDVACSIEARWCRTITAWLVVAGSLACGDHVIVGREVLTSKARDAAVPTAEDAGPSKVQAAHAERARAQANDKSENHADDGAKASDDDKNKEH